MDITDTILVSAAGLITTFFMIVVLMILNLGRRIDSLDNKVDANAATSRKELQHFRHETRNNFETTNRKIDANTAGIDANTSRIDRLADKVEANGIAHDREIKKVGEQVTGFTERVAKVEGYIEAVSAYTDN